MEDYEEGDRIGGYVVLRDVDGRLHALRAPAVQAVSQLDDGGGDECMLTLPGGRLLRVPRSFGRVLDWLS